MNLIVAYDIADPRRLRRIAKIMEDYGLRVQKSIFEAELDPGAFRQMRLRAEHEMEPSEDGVKYFPVCAGCSQTLEVIGSGEYIDPDSEFYIV